MLRFQCEVPYSLPASKVFVLVASYAKQYGERPVGLRDKQDSLSYLLPEPSPKRRIGQECVAWRSSPKEGLSRNAMRQVRRRQRRGLTVLQSVRDAAQSSVSEVRSSECG